jgi:hypothetical protein
MIVTAHQYLPDVFANEIAFMNFLGTPHTKASGIASVKHLKRYVAAVCDHTVECTCRANASTVSRTIAQQDNRIVFRCAA